MKKFNKLTDDLIGRIVLYKDEEFGRLKSFDNTMRIAWVVYKCGEDWEHWQAYTAAQTNYSDLKLMETDI